jgi:hypothetical protein
MPLIYNKRFAKINGNAKRKKTNDFEQKAAKKAKSLRSGFFANSVPSKTPDHDVFAELGDL